MKAFIVGCYSPFSIALIERLAKEGWESFVLSGTKKTGGISPRGVFEEYQYEYDNDIVKYIMESVRPDVVIFTGAYDLNLNFDNIRRSAVKYISGLTNLLISCRLNQIRHFIYLSSEKVFEGSFEDRIQEDHECRAEDYAGMTILQGEKLCGGYQKNGEFEVTVLRLINMFGIPRRNEPGRDFYSTLCMKLIRGSVITYHPERKFSCIYIPDAVEAVYRIMSAPRRKHSVYHIASHDVIEEKDMLYAIKTWEKDGTGFEAAGDYAPESMVFSSERIREEFGFEEKYHFEKVSYSIYKYFMKHSKDLLPKREFDAAAKKSRLKEAGRKIKRILLPHIESIAVFFAVFLLSRTAQSNEILNAVDFFYLYVLLFGIVYGRKLSLTACLLSVAGRLWILSGQAGMFAVVTDLKTYLWILMLFLIGMSVGHLKDTFKKNLEEREEQIHYLNMEIDDLNNINESNMAIKKLYETRLVNYQDSLGKIYSITSRLDELEPGKVLINAALVIEQIMGTKDVAIYNVVNADYCRLAIATSEKARMLGKSKKYRMWGELYESISKNEVYINKTLDEDFPMMAHAIYSQDDMEMIIMVWGLAFEQLTLYQSNLLMILGKMMYESIHRAYKYMETINNQHFIEGTQIMEEAAFREIIQNEQYANEMGMSEYTVLGIQTDEKPLFDWYQKLKGMIRDSDSIGLLEEREIGILLTNTAQADSLIVVDRLKKLGVRCRVGRGGKGL